MASRISPSMYDGLSICPCFQYKIFKGGGANEEGTLLHSAAEGEDVGELTGEQEHSVQMATAAVDVLLVSYLGWKDDDAVHYREHHEQKMANSLGHRGKMDRCYVALPNRKALIVDFKFGRLGLIADAVDSLQMAGYADTIFHTYADVDEIMVSLISPRTQELSSHVWKREDWAGIKAKLQAVQDEFDKAFKAPRFNEVLCTKCGLIGECPAATKTLAPAGALAVDLPISALMKPVEELSITELSQNLAISDLLTAWAKERKPMISERVFQEDLDVPGYSKQSRAGSKFIPVEDAPEAFRSLSDAMAAEDFIGICGKPSLNKLAEFFMDASTGDTKTERKRNARDGLENRLADLIKQGAPKQFLQRRAKLDLRTLAAPDDVS